jgi:hypothetical protein
LRELDIVDVNRGTRSTNQSPQITEVQENINSLNPKISPGYDLITSKILKELPTVGIQYPTQLFNAVLLKGYFPAQWKVAQIFLIPKPGKPPHELTSYRPISKVLEKLLLKRLLPIVEKINEYQIINLASDKGIPR